jgi:hypothetical protein
MRLSCQKAFFIAAGVTMGCNHEVTAPLRPLSGVYLLESVNGRPVPAIVYAEQADTTFMLSATLTLDNSGNAVRAEHWRYVYPPNRIDEGTFIANVEYRISGNNITVGSFQRCAANALCEGLKVGKFTSTTLTLAYANNPTAPVFLYRLAPSL